MRCRYALVAGLALLSVGACTDAQRPTQLVGVLYHGFTVVDASAGQLTPDAWVLVVNGQIEQRGTGTPPSGAYIAQFDLSGHYGLPQGGDDFAFLVGNPLAEMREEQTSAFIMTGGLLTETAAIGAALKDGTDLSSPEHS